MLTHDMISEKVNKIAPLYPLKRVSYFGSYANGKQTENSDLDILVEFLVPVGLIMLSSFRLSLEDELRIRVDVVPYPLPEGAMITIDNEVPVYGQ